MNMASRCNSKYSWCFLQNPRLWVLVLVWTVTWAMSESDEMKSVSGEIGGTVTFPCPVDKDKTVTLFYIQRGTTFVNGYYKSKHIPEEAKPWENTNMDLSETALHMYGLNISHAGVYQCHIKYSDSDTIRTIDMNVTVTANYSKPAVTTTCTDENQDSSCLVTCASHGGYPEVRMRFTGNLSGNSSDQMWRVVNSSEVRNPDTMMFDSSSTAYFNCSYGALHLLSCTVGESTSDMFSVCTPRKGLSPHVLATAVAVCLLLVVVAVVGLRLHCKCKERHAEAAQCRANGCAEEVVVLTEVTRKQAS